MSTGIAGGCLFNKRQKRQRVAPLTLLLEMIKPLRQKLFCRPPVRGGKIVFRKPPQLSYQGCRLAAGETEGFSLAGSSVGSGVASGVGSGSRAGSGTTVTSAVRVLSRSSSRTASAQEPSARYAAAFHRARSCAG